MARKPARQRNRKAGPEPAKEKSQSDSGLRSLPQLIVLTGVPQGRIMQAVREGFLVAAVKGKYQLGPALLSIIKFLNSRADKLPTYDNAAQCSAMTGIPVDVITQARKIKLLGPGGDNRISLETLLQVMFESRGENWTEMQSKFSALREKRRFEQEDGMWIEKSEASQTIKRGLAGVFRMLDQRSNVRS